MPMGKVDTVTKAYMRKNNIFADAFNYLIYDGKPVVNPEQLRELDTTEIALPFGLQENEKGPSNDLVQKYRDILKSAVVMQEDEAAYILLGIENQTDIHYAMPVRNMIYDALQYGKQVADTAANHRKNDKSFRKRTSGEYLSGFYKEDVLKPVVTLVIHFGADEWDAPLSLHEMMEVRSEKLLHYIQDYRIHLIDPANLTEEDLVKFTSSLREVMEYIKYSKDKDNLARILKDNPRMVIDREAAMVIKTITNTSIEIAEGKEEIDMCEAVEAMLSESEAKGIEKGMQQGKKEGIEIGELRMLVKQIKKGRLTIEEAAEDAAMSLEEFRKVMESNVR